MKKEKPKTDPKMSALPESEISTATGRPFTHLTDDSAFTDTHYFIDTTTVHLIRPPLSHPNSRPWITARETTKNYTLIFRHPLTSKPYSVPLSRNSDFAKLEPSTLTNSYSFGKSASLDKLLPLPSPRYDFGINISYYTVLVLYGGGELKGCPSNPRSVTVSGQRIWPWVKLTSRGEKFDDIVEFEGKVYAVDRQGLLKLVNYYKTVKKIKIGKTVVFHPVLSGSGRFGWRKRFVVDGGVLYLVVRMEEKKFRVYMLKGGGRRFYWEEVRRFGGDKVLFMARDHCFFRRASRKFPGREYMNCIVFSEAAFPQYGNDCWEFTQCGDRQFSEDDIAVFRLGDQVFARESENSCFPKIDWSPPDWILTASSFRAAEFRKHTVSESSSQSERESDAEERLVGSDSGDKNGEEVQSRLKDSKSKDEDEQEEMESDFGSLDQDQRWVEFDSDSLDQADEKMQCDSNSQEKEDVGMHVNANTEGGVSLQENVSHVSPFLFRPESGTTVTQTPSLSATEKEITRTLLSLNDGNNATTEEETLRNNNTELVHRAGTSSTTVSHRSDTATAKFEGMDIRLDSVSTLEKIWQKHGNIVENCAVRNSEIIARALESLASIVRILDDSSALSLSDIQAEYIVSTLSDLRYIYFKVDWLIPFVEKAKKIHQSKASLESLNSLRQLNSEAEERRAILLEELTKLDAEEKKRKEEMAKISKTIPFCGQVKLDEPLGSGLT